MKESAIKYLNKALRNVDGIIERIEKFVLSFSVMGMACVSISNVVARNVFGSSLTFAEELNQILIVALTFMGIGYGVRHARHIRMSALYEQLRGLPRKSLMVVSSFGTALLLFTLTWYAVQYVGMVREIGSLTPALQVPLYLVYLAAPAGLALGGIQYVLAGLRNVTSTGIHESYHLPECVGDAQREG